MELIEIPSELFLCLVETLLEETKNADDTSSKEGVEDNGGKICLVVCLEFTVSSVAVVRETTLTDDNSGEDNDDNESNTENTEVSTGVL